MNLKDRINLLFKPAYELSSEKYYDEQLNSKDSRLLRNFVNKLGKSMKIPSAILAVGSSTFPEQHWEDYERLNQKHNLQLDLFYRDIDLFLVPHSQVSLSEYETSISETLEKLGTKYESKKSAIMGVSLREGWSVNQETGETEKIIGTWSNIDYGLHSITTELPNGTNIDLIIGREDLLQKTAEMKIAEERKYKNPFSLLYN